MRTDKTTANSGGFHYTLLISALGNLGPGGYRRKRSFVSVLLSVGVGVVSRVYARSVFAHSNETWQSRSLVNGLQLCEAVRSYNETHVTYSSLKTSSR